MKTKTNATRASLLTKEQLAKYLNLKPRGIETLAASGKIPVLRISHRCVRYDLEKVLQAIQRYEQPETRRGMEGGK